MERREENDTPGSCSNDRVSSNDPESNERQNMIMLMQVLKNNIKKEMKASRSKTKK